MRCPRGVASECRPNLPVANPWQPRFMLPSHGARCRVRAVPLSCATPSFSTRAMACGSAQEGHGCLLKFMLCERRSTALASGAVRCYAIVSACAHTRRAAHPSGSSSAQRLAHGASNGAVATAGERGSVVHRRSACLCPCPASCLVQEETSLSFRGSRPRERGRARRWQVR